MHDRLVAPWREHLASATASKACKRRTHRRCSIVLELRQRRQQQMLAAAGRRWVHVVLPPGKGPNVEAIRLYRDILRECRHYNWRDERGQRWGDVLARSARNEFEQARFERDPELIARMLVVGRDALMRTQEKFAEKRFALDQQQAVGARGR